MRATALYDVELDNPVVASIKKNGGTDGDCIIALHNLNINLSNKVMQLEMIAPFRIKVGEKMMIWRCPEDLVPIREDLTLDDKK